MIGPSCESPPPLVASVGGPWTIANIAPLVDRVELKFGATTRRGNLDDATLAATTRDDLVHMIDLVRAVAPDTPIGLFVMIAVGDDAEVAAFRDTTGDGLYGEFIGEPARVLDNLRALGVLGIDRVQVTERLKGSIERLGPVA